MSTAYRNIRKAKRKAARAKDKDLANIRNIIRNGKAPRFHFARNNLKRIVIRFTTGLFTRGRSVMEGKRDANS